MALNRVDAQTKLDDGDIDHDRYPAPVLYDRPDISTFRTFRTIGWLDADHPPGGPPGLAPSSVPATV